MSLSLPTASSNSNVVPTTQAIGDGEVSVEDLIAHVDAFWLKIQTIVESEGLPKEEEVDIAMQSLVTALASLFRAQDLKWRRHSFDVSRPSLACVADKARSLIGYRCYPVRHMSSKDGRRLTIRESPKSPLCSRNPAAETVNRGHRGARHSGSNPSYVLTNC
jgi:hypothetical protein